MMNRSVMKRQMFKYGGDVKKMEMGGAPTGQMTTFVNPESGERVTLDMANEADVQMMDRLVSAGFVMDSPAMSQSPRFAEVEAEAMGSAMPFTAMPFMMASPRFAEGEAERIKGMQMGGVVEMQAGGDPMMAMQEQMPPEGIASMMPAESMPAAPGPDMTSMGVGEVDQGTMEQMLTEVAPEIGDPEQAEDFETMMNSVRGDEASVDQRRAELATLVGEEDAAQTPESVLALVQPVVQMSMVDQGIGGLAEQEMQQPVQGDMAGGIMSMMGG